MICTYLRLTDYEVALRRRWSHLHSLAITGLSLVPEHNFLLSIGNDGACRVLDYLKVQTAVPIMSALAQATRLNTGCVQ